MFSNFIKKYPKSTLVALSLCLYAYCLTFDFLNYDDNLNIYENRHLLSGDWNFFWTQGFVSLYIPVTYTVWLGLFKTVGLNAAFYHGVVLLFHILNVLLVFQIIKKLISAVEAAFVGALFFSIHPLQIQSVAWATGLKDTLFFFFALSATYSYLFYKNRLSGRVAFLFFEILAILSKPTAAVLPVCLYAVDFFKSQDGRFKNRLFSTAKQNKVLLLAMVLGGAALVYSKILQGTEIASQVAVSGYEKLIVFFDSLGFYLKKILLPIDLYPDYGRIPRVIIDENIYILNLIIGVLFSIALLVYFFRIHKKRNDEHGNVILFALFFSAVFYMPTSGLVSFGFQSVSTVADRYMYPVMFGLAVLISTYYKKFAEFADLKKLRLSILLLFIFLTFLNFTQLINWKNDLLFTQNMLEGNPRNYYANHNLGQIYQKQGRQEEALPLFTNAHELDPKRLAPVAGLVTANAALKRFADMESFGQKSFQAENIQQMTMNKSTLVIIYRAYALSYLEQKKPARALLFLCLTRGLLDEPSAQLDSLIADAKAMTGPEMQNCPNDLSAAGKLF